MAFNHQTCGKMGINHESSRDLTIFNQWRVDVGVSENGVYASNFWLFESGRLSGIMTIVWNQIPYFQTNPYPGSAI